MKQGETCFRGQMPFSCEDTRTCLRRRASADSHAGLLFLHNPAGISSTMVEYKNILHNCKLNGHSHKHEREIGVDKL